MTNVTAPSYFGNISSYGPITGTVQSTGVRTDPIFGTTSTAGADIGRTYVTLGAAGQPTVTTSTIQTDINGRPAFGPMGLTGRLISRRNLISQVSAAGGIYGAIAVQGDIGSFSPLLSRTNLARVGGISTDTNDTGQIVAQGQIIGDVNIGGGLIVTKNGNVVVSQGIIAAKGNILGNVKINGPIATGAAIISGGSIGSTALNTGISFQSNLGIIAADGGVTNKLNSPTVTPGYFSSNDAQVPSPFNFDAQVIDEIFNPTGNPFAGLDILANGDLADLTDILNELALLHIFNGHLSVNRNGK
jgi:hypothetical protein